MKATGIVRRIDDLGRVVIPKEIRRTLRIRESDPLEIFTDREGEIILKKVFSHRRAEYLCQRICGGIGSGGGLYCLYHRQRPDYSCSRKRRQGVCGQKNPQ